MKNKITILCLTKHYLPGIESGGVTRSIVNLVDCLGDEFNIKIVCCDHDLNSSTQYSNVKIDKWNLVGKAYVFYASRKLINLWGLVMLLRKTSFDVLYLNGIFSFAFTIIPLLVRRMGLIPQKPCLIAIRGQLSKESMSQKSIKKKCFLYLAKHFNLFKNIYWQASTDRELKDIKLTLDKVAKSVFLASDLVKKTKNLVNNNSIRKQGPIRIIFLSRIAPNKNLDFLLSVLTEINLRINFSIFGPKEDKRYWIKCKKLINNLPNNIKIKIGDNLSTKRVYKAFAQHDLFAFPTTGENFGHVILESLSVGTPVLISDQTLWKPNKSKSLKILPLKKNIWIKAIKEWATLPVDNFLKHRLDAINYANKFIIDNDKQILINKKLFYSIANSNQ